jgi:hypothetical protein
VSTVDFPKRSTTLTSPQSRIEIRRATTL